MSDAAIRMAILFACRVPLTTHELVDAVEKRTRMILSAGSAGNMAARLHRAGWLAYSREQGEDRHVIAAAGETVLALLGEDYR